MMNTRKTLILIFVALVWIISSFAQHHNECDEQIETALMEYLGIDDIEELFDYMDSLEEAEVDEVLEAIDIEEIERVCESGGKSEHSDDPELGTPTIPPTNTATKEAAFEITEIPDELPTAFSVFSQHVSIFGIHVLATSDVSAEKVLHAATILAEYLDNDEDGAVDNELVLETMLGKGAALIMFGEEDSPEFIQFEENRPDEVMAQLLYGFETHPEGSQGEEFDATLEEVLHLVTTVGYSQAYPEIWGEVRNSEVARLMDEMIAAGHYNPYANEADIPYADSVSEYIYWSLTSLLGAQDYHGRGSFIRHEWKLNTADLMNQHDPEMVRLLGEPEYALPTVLPDGVYTFSSDKN